MHRLVQAGNRYFRLGEITSGITCVCVPVFPRLLQFLEDRFRSAYSGSVIRRRSSRWYGKSGSKDSALEGSKPFFEITDKDRVKIEGVQRGLEGKGRRSQAVIEQPVGDLESGLDGDGLILKTVDFDRTSLRRL